MWSLATECPVDVLGPVVPLVIGSANRGLYPCSVLIDLDCTMSVRAHAPGSVTTIFAPQEGEASLGVSFATADGVTATVEPAPDSVILLGGRRACVEPVSGVLRRLDVTAKVHLETAVPIGCGFGVSGAATLATALAVNEACALGLDRNQLVEASHQAELAAGTGLGDVFIQDLGGLVWDVGEGLRHAEREARLEYTSFGDIATADVLGDGEAMARVADAGEAALASIDPEGPLATLFDRSWGFADRVALATGRVAETVKTVRRAGGAATMAMIGETVIATESNGLLENETWITPRGAALR